MKSFLHTLLLLAIFTTINNAQWVSQKSDLINNNLYSVKFINLNTGWIVGSQGTILKTTNRGSEWTKMHSGIITNLNSVHFFDEDNGIAVGDDAVILKTTDGGSSWNNVSIANGYELTSIYFVDKNYGWTVGSESKILKTTDSGNTWQLISNVENSYMFRSVFFIDQNTGWVVGDEGIIMKTTDGGNNWILQTSNTTLNLNSVVFTDANTGSIVGDNAIYLKTSDGGTNWSQRTIGTWRLSSIYFVDQNVGWIVGTNIYKTVNGGVDWEKQEVNIYENLFSVFFIDKYTGWAVGGTGDILYHTTELNEMELIWKVDRSQLPAGGSSWSTPLIMNNKLFWAGQDRGFAALDAETGDILWMDTLNFLNGTYDSPVGANGKVFISNNNYMDPTNRNLIAFDAETGDTIWKKRNFYTVNRSSKPIVVEPMSQGGKLYAASNDTLYCFDINDGSVLWQRAGKYSNLLVDYNSVRLFAARSDNAVIDVFNVYNGELFWSKSLPDNGVSIASLAYTIYYSQGESYEFLVIAPGTRAKPIFYCMDVRNQNIIWSNEYIGYVGNKATPVIYGDRVYVGVEKTTGNVPQEVVAFSLINGNIVWRNHARSSGATNTPYVVVLDDKVFYHSSENNFNEGVMADIIAGSITAIASPGFQNPWPLVWGSPLIYNNKLYIVKDGEGIFCYDAGPVFGEWTMLGGNIHATNSFTRALVSVEKYDLEIPSGYELFQNYPNPFNPSTTISFNLPLAGNVKLSVYDILGRQITKLIDEFLSAGNYKINFNAGNLASGVYFYRIESNGIVINKKMNFIK